MKLQMCHPIERTSSQNGEQTRVTLSNVEVDAMIKNAVERELLKYGIDRNQNNSRSEVVQMSSRVNNQLIDDNGPSDVHSNRATHFIVNNGNNDQNWSREYNCPDPAALAKQIQPSQIVFSLFLSRVKMHFALA